MKKSLNIFLFLLILYSNTLFSKIITENNFTPININFVGIEANVDKIVVFGTFGACLISYDSAKTWHQKQIFQNGLIIDIKIDKNILTAFAENGEVSFSNNNGSSWNNVYHFNDTVYSVIYSADGYLVRTKTQLILLNKSFKIDKNIELDSREYLNYIENKYYYKTGANGFKLNTLYNYYKYSTDIFRGIYYVYTDSNTVTRYDANLKFIDSYNLENNCSNCFSGHQIQSSDNYIYFRMSNSILRTSSLINFENYNSLDKISKFRIVNDKVISYSPGVIQFKEIQKDTTLNLGKLNDKEFYNRYGTFGVNDFLVFSNQLFFIRERSKIIYSLDYKYENLNQNVNIISNAIPAINSFFEILELNDSTHFLKQNGYIGNTNDQYSFINFNYLDVYKTTNFGVTFKPTLNYDNNIGKLFPSFNEYYNKNELVSFIYDKLSNYYFFNYLDTFKNYKLYEMQYQHYSNILTNIIKDNEGNFLFCDNNSHYLNDSLKSVSIVNFYDKEFNFQDSIVNQSELIRFIQRLDDEKFVYVGLNPADSNIYINSTIDKFQSKERLYTFENSYYYHNSINDFEFNDNKYITYFHYTNDLQCRVFLFNLTNFKIDTLLNFEISNEELNNLFIRNHNIASFKNDTLFIAIKNKIYIKDMKEVKDSLDYYTLPRNGFFTNSFQKLNKRFVGFYQDDIKEPNSYWLDISFKEVEDPKPIIQADDYDFGKFDIKETDYKKTKVKVENLSKEADLEINNFTITDTLNFKSDIYEVINELPIVIKKGETIEIKFEFKPKNVGLIECKIEFNSNALTQDEYIELKGEAIDTIKTSVEDIEEISYLYTLPPYPNPTVSEVTAKFYWDSRIDIDNSDIAVFDITGNKVSGKENLTLEKLNEWSGNIKWNCANQPKGTYLIKIQHGNNTKTVKVVVN
jgi:hypothetical protein